MTTATAKKHHVDDGFEFRGLKADVPFNPIAAQQHLAILQLFCALIDDCRASAPLTLVRAGTRSNLKPAIVTAVQRVEHREVRAFLTSATVRYFCYLELLKDLIKRSPEGVKVKLDELPLPPWDVAIVMHSHMLAPFYYVEDMGLRTKFKEIWDLGIAFPLRRLNTLISEDIWSDPESAKTWNEMYPQSDYQVWDDYPHIGGKFKLNLPTEMYCSNCTSHYGWTHEIWRGFVAEGVIIICGSCKKHHTTDTDNLENLRQDLQAFLDDPDGQFAGRGLRGQAIDLRTGEPKYRRIATDLRRLDLAKTSFWRTLKGTTDWEKVFKAARDSQIASAASTTPMIQKQLLTTMCQSYRRGSWLSCFTLDLTSAVIRQQSFARKIVAKFCQHRERPLQAASARYYKFMLLMKVSAKKKNRSLVPTLDVDLLWHTHQLYPKYYHSWCLQNIGRRINHDDTIQESELKTSFEDTQTVWQETYGESYLKTTPSNSLNGHQPAEPLVDGSSVDVPHCFHPEHSHASSNEAINVERLSMFNDAEEETLLNEVMSSQERSAAVFELVARELKSRLEEANKASTLSAATKSDEAALFLPTMVEMAEYNASKTCTSTLHAKLEALEPYTHAMGLIRKSSRACIENLERDLRDDNNQRFSLADLLPYAAVEAMNEWISVHILFAKVKAAPPGDEHRAYVQLLRESRERLESIEGTLTIANTCNYFNVAAWGTHISLVRPQLVASSITYKTPHLESSAQALIALFKAQEEAELEAEAEAKTKADAERAWQALLQERRELEAAQQREREESLRLDRERVLLEHSTAAARVRQHAALAGQLRATSLMATSAVLPSIDYSVGVDNSSWDTLYNTTTDWNNDDTTTVVCASCTNVSNCGSNCGSGCGNAAQCGGGCGGGCS